MPATAAQKRVARAKRKPATKPQATKAGQAAPNSAVQAGRLRLASSKPRGRGQFLLQRSDGNLVLGDLIVGEDNSVTFEEVRHG